MSPAAQAFAAAARSWCQPMGFLVVPALQKYLTEPREQPGRIRVNPYRLPELASLASVPLSPTGSKK